MENEVIEITEEMIKELEKNMLDENNINEIEEYEEVEDEYTE